MVKKKSLFENENQKNSGPPIDWTIGAKRVSLDRMKIEDERLKQIDTGKPWYDQVLQKHALHHPVTATAYEMATQAKRRAERAKVREPGEDDEVFE